MFMVKEEEELYINKWRDLSIYRAAFKWRAIESERGIQCALILLAQVRDARQSERAMEIWPMYNGIALSRSAQLKLSRPKGE